MTYVRVKQLSARLAGKLGGTTENSFVPLRTELFILREQRAWYNVSQNERKGVTS